MQITSLFASVQDRPRPVAWKKIGDELFFSRLIVNSDDFSIAGVSVFSVSDDFLVFFG